MRRRLPLASSPMIAAACLALAGAVSLAPGCAGDAARVRAAGPQMAAMAPDVLADAEIGVRAQSESVMVNGAPVAVAELLGVEPMSPQMAESRRVHHREFGALLETFTRPGGDGGGG